MATQLERAIRTAQVIDEITVTGPRGGCKTTIKYLDDGRIAATTPDVHNVLPRWIQALLPAGHRFRRCGGTTYQSNNWISERK